MPKIYLDNAATTFVSEEVLNEMLPSFGSEYGNANSTHSFGRDAMALVDIARDRIANGINAKSSEIYFTSGGTESNNWAIIGLAMANRDKGNHIITSQIEHHSVLDACKKLETMGFEVTYLPVDDKGLVSIADLLHYLNDKTILVSIMAANNEIGTIQNLKTIAKITHEKNVIFHTDAVQAVGAFKIDVDDIGIDAMSMSSHKIHGPKGVGALYVRKKIKIDPYILGGSQENGKRGGTLNVPGIVGFGKAFEIAIRDYLVNNKKLKTLHDYFVNKLTKELQYVKVNGHYAQRLPGIASITFETVDAEALLLLLDLDGIACSLGSACMAGSTEPSHVLKAIGLTVEESKSTIRFSFGTNNTKEEIDFVVDKIKKHLTKLRGISPLRPNSKKNGIKG